MHTRPTCCDVCIWLTFTKHKLTTSLITLEFIYCQLLNSNNITNNFLWSERLNQKVKSPIGCRLRYNTRTFIVSLILCCISGWFAHEWSRRHRTRPLLQVNKLRRQHRWCVGADLDLIQNPACMQCFTADVHTCNCCFSSVQFSTN